MPDLLQIEELRRRAADVDAGDTSFDDELRDCMNAGLRWLKEQACWAFWPRVEQVQAFEIGSTQTSVLLPWPLTAEADIVDVTLDDTSLAAGAWVLVGPRLNSTKGAWPCGAVLQVKATVGFAGAEDMASLRTAARKLFEHDWNGVPAQLQSQGDEGGTATFRHPSTLPAEVKRFLDVVSFKRPQLG